MRIERVPLEELHQDPQNARKHDARNLRAITTSLTTFGQQKPIVATKDGTILAGNGTFMAARQLGWQELIVVRTELEGQERLAYAIADNKTSDLSEWEYEQLGELLNELAEEDTKLLKSVGFAETELRELLKLDEAWTLDESKDEEERIEELAQHVNGQRRRPVFFDAEQWKLVERAAKRVRREQKNSKLKTSSCLVLLLKDFLRPKRD